MAFGAHMRPYSYIYYAPHRDGVLHSGSSSLGLPVLGVAAAAKE